MRNSSQLVGGRVLIGLGILFLLSNMFNVNLWEYFWPLLLIGLGALLLLRRPNRDPEARTHERFIGDIDRYGHWAVQNENINLFVGDVNLDLTAAAIPSGTTDLRVNGFVGDVSLRVPRGVGVKLEAHAVAGDVRLADQKQDILFSEAHFTSGDYASAERRINLHTNFFAGDVTVEQVAAGV